MKVRKNITVFQCEFCQKKMFLKYAMEKHEKWCNSNPDNFRACYGCSNLEELEVNYSFSVSTLGENLGVIFDGETIERKTTGFRCKELDKYLYPFKAEKLGLPEKYPETFENKEPMPKICVHYS